MIDGWVVDVTAFLFRHPGGLAKLLSTDEAKAGATGKPFGFSFTRGRNSHLRETGRIFNEGVKKLLQGTTLSEGIIYKNGEHLPPVEVHFPNLDKIVIIGRLDEES